MNSHNFQQPQKPQDSFFLSTESLLMGLKANIDPFENTSTSSLRFMNNQTHQRIDNLRDLPKLVSPKPQRPTFSNFSGLQRTLSSQFGSNMQRNLSREFPRQINFSSQQSNAVLSRQSSSSVGLQLQQQVSNDQRPSLKDALINNFKQIHQQNIQKNMSSHSISELPSLNIGNRQSSFTAFSKSFAPFSKDQNLNTKSQSFNTKQQETSNPQINNFDFKITNNNYFAALPDCLTQLLKQASSHLLQQTTSSSSCKSLDKVLGKRKRTYRKQQSSKNNESSQEYQEAEKSSSSSAINYNSENINRNENSEDEGNSTAMLNDAPTKRRHVSSLSKAMLAKKILSKIETENDPSANVIPKQAQIHNKDTFGNEFSNDQSVTTIEQQQTISSISPQVATVPIVESQAKTCNCKRSKCLKLYCECFANNKFCGANCACNGCSNVASHDDERLQAKESILMRNPLAFRPKIETSLDENSIFKKEIKIDQINIQEQSDVLLSVSTKPANFGVLAVGDKEKRHFKGCNCKKSFCQKKYCECFQSGVNCTDLCKCEECKNNETCKPCTFEQMFKVQKEVKKPQQFIQTPMPLLQSNSYSEPLQELPQSSFLSQKNSISQSNLAQTPKKEEKSVTFSILKEGRLSERKSPLIASKSNKKNFFGNEENNPALSPFRINQQSKK